MYIPRNIHAVQLGNFCTPDCAVAQLRWQDCDLIVVSGYMDINLPVIFDWLVVILDHFERTNASLILSLDSNAHSSFYSMAQTNARGRRVEEFILRYVLQVENRGSIQTFECERVGQ